MDLQSESARNFDPRFQQMLVKCITDMKCWILIQNKKFQRLELKSGPDSTQFFMPQLESESVIIYSIVFDILYNSHKRETFKKYSFAFLCFTTFLLIQFSKVNTLAFQECHLPGNNRQRDDSRRSNVRVWHSWEDLQSKLSSDCQMSIICDVLGHWRSDYVPVDMCL